MLAFTLHYVKNHHISTRKFTMTGCVWAIKALVPDSLTSGLLNKMVNSAVDFDETFSEVVWMLWMVRTLQVDCVFHLSRIYVVLTLKIQS